VNRRIILLSLVFVVGCRDREHGSVEAHREHGSAPGAEVPARSVTVWAQRTELFMEYSPLIVAKEARFAAHVTEMPSFKAVTAGSATLTLVMKDGSSLVGTASGPSNPGIFRPTITPAAAGDCELRMAIESPQVTETFAVGPCQVFADEATARKQLGSEPEPPGRITFLKEQQWKTDFAIMAVAERDLQDGVRAAGEIQPAAGKHARLTAPASGRVVLAEPVPILGMLIRKGQVLASIVPRLSGGSDRVTMAADVTAAEAEAEAARAALERAQRLLAAQAGPQKAVDEATTRLKVADARLAGARGRLAQFDAGASGAGGGRVFQIRSPIEGSLAVIDAASGQGVEEGQGLFSVIDLDRVWLVVKVFEPDVPKVEAAHAAIFTIEGHDQPFVVDAANGKLVTVGRVVDPRTRTVPVIFEVDNRAGKLRIGNFTRTVIATGAPRKALAIPDSAIVDDAGKPTAFVMIEGEMFERRPLRLGIRSNGWSEVLDGLAAGERVVTRGAYEVRLASSSGAIPAHGHVH
jgi:membrane fusion protein, heavy metal efflux system